MKYLKLKSGDVVRIFQNKQKEVTSIHTMVFPELVKISYISEVQISITYGDKTPYLVDNLKDAMEYLKSVSDNMCRDFILCKGDNSGVIISDDTTKFISTLLNSVLAKTLDEITDNGVGAAWKPKFVKGNIYKVDVSGIKDIPTELLRSYVTIVDNEDLHIVTAEIAERYAFLAGAIIQSDMNEVIPQIKDQKATSIDEQLPSNITREEIKITGVKIGVITDISIDPPFDYNVFTVKHKGYNIPVKITGEYKPCETFSVVEFRNVVALICDVRIRVMGINVYTTAKLMIEINGYESVRVKLVNHKDVDTDLMLGFELPIDILLHYGSVDKETVCNLISPLFKYDTRFSFIDEEKGDTVDFKETPFASFIYKLVKIAKKIAQPNSLCVINHKSRDSDLYIINTDSDYEPFIDHISKAGVYFINDDKMQYIFKKGFKKALKYITNNT